MLRAHNPSPEKCFSTHVPMSSPCHAFFDLSQGRGDTAGALSQMIKVRSEVRLALLPLPWERSLEQSERGDPKNNAEPKIPLRIFG